MGLMIEIGSRQIVKGMTQEQRAKLEEYTTVDNQKYEQAMRFSKWGKPPKKIPKYIRYYQNTKDGLELPRGIDVAKILGEKCEYIDRRHFTGVKYPQFRMTLRSEQEQAEKAYMKAHKCNVFNEVIHLPTGKGKTILALHIASTLGAKTLVIVHKNDLVVGWKKDIQDCFGEELVPGLIKAKSRKVGEQLTIATVQTLDRMADEELEGLVNIFDLVIQDEVHHVGANTFNIVDVFNAKYRLGLSATPHRADGLDCCLEFYYGGLCYKYQYKEEDEDIASVQVKVAKSRFKFKPILVDGEVFNYYDFTIENMPNRYEVLEEIEYVHRPRVASTVIDGIMLKDLAYRRQVLNDVYREWREGHSVLLLFTQKEYIDLYYDSLSEFIPEEQIMRYYGDSKESDGELLQKAESGEVKITLATFAKATEGTNCKAWEVLFFVSSIASEKNTEQAIGRIRRRKEGKLDPVRVYDYKCDGYILRNHFPSRMRVYNKLKCEIIGSVSQTTFMRGYKNR